MICEVKKCAFNYNGTCCIQIKEINEKGECANKFVIPDGYPLKQDIDELIHEYVKYYGEGKPELRTKELIFNIEVLVRTIGK